MVPQFPHDGVLIRLAPSPISGIGVFAMEMIAAGTEIFPHDRHPIRWIPATVLDDPRLRPWQRALYEDFAIRRGDQLGCPESFDQLTTGWFLNEPMEASEPNVHATADYRFVAARDIAAGEELTVRYESFSVAGGD